MAYSSANRRVQSASLTHMALLDEFIRITKDKLGTQDDAFVRDSLGDLLLTLRDERDGYARLVEMPALEEAA
ncbi:hypothetical protein [Azospirillum sp.]|uniref:hypothetical protein n=1 Tax=Azospirillum sp. TaxID=34012 RepID=UPI003D724F4A